MAARIPTGPDRRDKEILEWIEKHDPSLLPDVTRILREQGEIFGWAFKRSIYDAFEAGRRYQAENPHVKLDDPKAYL